MRRFLWGMHGSRGASFYVVDTLQEREVLMYTAEWASALAAYLNDSPERAEDVVGWKDRS